jgi:uncharacterized repeat protein (TIGR01451 family)
VHDEQVVISRSSISAGRRWIHRKPVEVGNNITWTIVVTNNGPDTGGVTISDPIPAGTTFVSVTTTQGSCAGGDEHRDGRR